MTEKTPKAKDLDQFTGTGHWYRHGLVRTILFTDGAKQWPTRRRLLVAR